MDFVDFDIKGEGFELLVERFEEFVEVEAVFREESAFFCNYCLQPD